MLASRWTARRTFQKGLRPFELRMLLLAALSVCSTATPALPHHRQTPDVVALTESGDTPLTRQAAQARSTLVLASPAAGGWQIEKISPWRQRLDTRRVSMGLAGENA